MLYKCKIYVLTVLSYIKNFIFDPKPKGDWIRKYNPFYTSFNYKIINWQNRQKEIMEKQANALPKTFKSIKKWDLAKIHTKTIAEIKYTSDMILYSKRDYWATTDEILQTKTGDCEDQAHMIMLRLAKFGIDPDKLGCIVICTEDSCHALAIVQYKSNDFYVLDNGHLSYAMTTAKKLFTRRKDVKILAGYNFDDIWYYDLGDVNND